MKKIFTLLFCTLFLGMFSQNSDKQILEFTKVNYLKLIGAITEQKAIDFGFTNKDEINHLTFTKVIAEYMLVNNVPVKTNNYRVLAVNEKGKTRGLFTVYIDGSNMLVADYGASEFAKTISCSVQGFDKDAHISMLRMYNTKTDYLFDDASSSQSRKFLKLFENNFYSLTDIKKD